MIWHVIPLGDLKKHEESQICHCEPDTKFINGNIVVVHNSYDGREGVEWFNEILNSKKDGTEDK